MANLPSSDVLRHLVDVHCHPTDTYPVSPKAMEELQITVCAMASRTEDQALVRDLAASYPSKVVPCFGVLSEDGPILESLIEPFGLRRISPLVFSLHHA